MQRERNSFWVRTDCGCYGNRLSIKKREKKTMPLWSCVHVLPNRQTLPQWKRGLVAMAAVAVGRVAGGNAGTRTSHFFSISTQHHSVSVELRCGEVRMWLVLKFDWDRKWKRFFFHNNFCSISNSWIIMLYKKIIGYKCMYLKMWFFRSWEIKCAKSQL